MTGSLRGTEAKVVYMSTPMVGSVVWAKQGSCRYWPCVRHRLDSVTDSSLRRRLQEQARKLEAKHSSRRASGATPTEALVEFLGSHDYAWVNLSKVARFVAGQDAPVRSMSTASRRTADTVCAAPGRSSQIAGRVR